MEQHHSKHHAAYVTGANNALAQLAEARDKGQLRQHQPAFQGPGLPHPAGTSTTPCSGTTSPRTGGDKPEGELAAAIDDAFGSLDAFRAQFTAAAGRSTFL
jgi:superoxide dismutase, Fe-Mn family